MYLPENLSCFLSKLKSFHFIRSQKMIKYVFIYICLVENQIINDKMCFYLYV